MQLRHVGIVCVDIEASLVFYKKWFGCDVHREMNESGPFVSDVLGYASVCVRTIKLRFPEEKAQIELLSFETPKAENTKNLKSVGLTHLAIQVADLNSMYNNMVDSGVFFESEPKTSPDGLAKVCFCQDPNGVYIELVELLKK